jgi:hypothetical protein
VIKYNTAVRQGKVYKVLPLRHSFIMWVIFVSAYTAMRTLHWPQSLTLSYLALKTYIVRNSCTSIQALVFATIHSTAYIGYLPDNSCIYSDERGF